MFPFHEAFTIEGCVLWFSSSPYMLGLSVLESVCQTMLIESSVSFPVSFSYLQFISSRSNDTVPVVLNVMSFHLEGVSGDH